MNVPTTAPLERTQPQSGIPRLTANEDAWTDEEAFYAAQEASFADMRARLRARPRRKL